MQFVIHWSSICPPSHVSLLNLPWTSGGSQDGFLRNFLRRWKKHRQKFPNYIGTEMFISICQRTEMSFRLCMISGSTLVNQPLKEWMNQWKNERMNKWTDEGMNKWTNERTNEWTKMEKMNERMNERTKKWVDNSLPLITFQKSPRTSDHRFFFLRIRTECAPAGHVPVKDAHVWHMAMLLKVKETGWSSFSCNPSSLGRGKIDM